MLIADTSITATRQSVGATEGADILLPRVNCRHNGWEPGLGGSFLLAWLLPSAARSFAGGLSDGCKAQCEVC